MSIRGSVGAPFKLFLWELSEGESETFPKDVEGDVTSDLRLINLTPLSCVPPTDPLTASGGGEWREAAAARCVAYLRFGFCCFFFVSFFDYSSLLCVWLERRRASGNFWRKTGGPSVTARRLSSGLPNISTSTFERTHSGAPSWQTLVRV